MRVIALLAVLAASPAFAQTLLVDFGGTSSGNTFGTSWAQVVKDVYTDYRALGPGGLTITTENNGTYNFQGVTGPTRTFVADERVRMTWCNVSGVSISFVPRVSFTSAARPAVTPSAWFFMTGATIAPGACAVTEYVLTAAVSASVVNVNHGHFSNSVLIADKLELVGAGTPTPPPPPVFTDDVTLTWEAPTQNTDGSELTDLAGFKVYWGTSPGSYPNGVTLNNPGLLAYVVDMLAAGTWYFVVTALNSFGGESSPSDVASATIVAPSPTPINCVVNDPAWILGAPQPTTCPVSGTQSRTDTRTLTVLTQPANGGLACPSLNQTRTVSVTCTPPPVPTVTVTAVVPGLNMAPIFGITSAGGRGATVLGFVPVGRACVGPVVYRYRNADYRRFNAADAVWWASTATNNAAVACR